MYFVSYEYLRNVYGVVDTDDNTEEYYTGEQLVNLTNRGISIEGVISKDFIQVKQDFHSKFTTRLIHSQKRTKKLNQDLLNAIHKFDIEFDTDIFRCLSSNWR